MIKKMKLFAIALGFLALASCNDNSTKDQTTQETETVVVEEPVEEKKDVKLNVDADKNEVGVETEDVDINLKGEDNDN